MKQCRPNLGMKIVAAGVMLGLILPVSVFAAFLGLSNPDLPQGTRLSLLFGAALFAGCGLFALYRLIFTGIPFIEYDEKHVIFHFSRRESRTCTWESLPSERPELISKVIPSDTGYEFHFYGDGRHQKLAASRMSKGFRDFEKQLWAKGVLPRAGLYQFSKEAAGDLLERLKNALDGQRQPPPNVPHTVCPDCGGTGLRPPKKPGAKLRQVCKTCGGSGYLFPQ